MQRTIICTILIQFGIISSISAQNIADSIRVPIDYTTPNKDSFYLHYEFGAPYNPSLPTVVAIADGQQFWARPGRAKRFQKELFGEKMNVLVFFGRVQSEIIRQKVKDKEEVNWEEAYRLFNSNQWVEDIESIRKNVLKGKKINLYGRSGGGLLLLQYLAKYGEHVDKAFCQTAVYHKLEPELGYKHDKFWREITSYKPELGNKLLEAINGGYFKREDIILALQRQNFFIEASEINEKRELLINAIYQKDTLVFDSLKLAYQVDAIKKIKSTSYGISAEVRQYEFFMPYYNLAKNNNGIVDPNIEAIKYYAGPLVKLFKEGKIPYPTLDLSSLRDQNTQVFLFAARWDHTVDYRGQFYLAGLLKNSVLFIADDNHVFSKMYSTKNYQNLVQYALLEDADSKNMTRFLKQVSDLRWSEW